MSVTLEARALWHLEIGYEPEPERKVRGYLGSTVDGGVDDHDEDVDDGTCFDCGQIHDICECHVGDECGRWRNGSLSSRCMKAGSEECDFECPYRDSLRF